MRRRRSINTTTSLLLVLRGCFVLCSVLQSQVNRWLHINTIIAESSFVLTPKYKVRRLISRLLFLIIYDRIFVTVSKYMIKKYQLIGLIKKYLETYPINFKMLLKVFAFEQLSQNYNYDGNTLLKLAAFYTSRAIWYPIDRKLLKFLMCSEMN